jgi:hypothetical protein
MALLSRSFALLPATLLLSLGSAACGATGGAGTASDDVGDTRHGALSRGEMQVPMTMEGGCGPSTGGPGCNDGRVMCGNVCVDLRTSSDDCGACGHSCGVDARGAPAGCFSQQCGAVSVAAAVQPVGIAVSEGAVYWELSGGDVMVASPTGARAATLFAGAASGGASGGGLNVNLVVDSTRAYWVENFVPGGPLVQSVLLGGGGAATFDAVGSGLEALSAVAVDGANLYVARAQIDPQGGSCPSLGIDVVSLDGGAVTTMSGACRVVRLAVDGEGTVYWTDQGVAPSGHPAAIEAASVGSGSATATTIAAATSPWGIAVHGGRLYWSDGADVMVKALGSSAAASVLATSTQARDLVVDASGVYWIDAGHAIMNVSLEGGAARTIASGQNVVALATDASSVFWVDQGTTGGAGAGGAVMRVAK